MTMRSDSSARKQIKAKAAPRNTSHRTAHQFVHARDCPWAPAREPRAIHGVCAMKSSTRIAAVRRLLSWQLDHAAPSGRRPDCAEGATGATRRSRAAIARYRRVLGCAIPRRCSRLGRTIRRSSRLSIGPRFRKRPEIAGTRSRCTVRRMEMWRSLPRPHLQRYARACPRAGARVNRARNGPEWRVIFMV